MTTGRTHLNFNRSESRRFARIFPERGQPCEFVVGRKRADKAVRAPFGCGSAHVRQAKRFKIQAAPDFDPLSPPRGERGRPLDLFRLLWHHSSLHPFLSRRLAIPLNPSLRLSPRRRGEREKVPPLLNLTRLGSAALGCCEPLEISAGAGTPDCRLRFRGAHAPRVCRSAPPPTASFSNTSLQPWL